MEHILLRVNKLDSDPLEIKSNSLTFVPESTSVNAGTKLGKPAGWTIGPDGSTWYMPRDLMSQGRSREGYRQDRLLLLHRDDVESTQSLN